MPSEIVSVSLKHELRKELDKASKGNRSLYIREAIKDKLQKEFPVVLQRFVPKRMRDHHLYLSLVN